MQKEKMRSIDEYESFLSAIIEPWSPLQRAALAAAMAERWLPTYEAFSRAEQWGDTTNLRHILDVVWNYVQGQDVIPSELVRYQEQIQDSTPHMDDFDAPTSLAACVILSEALECCTADNLAATVRAALSGFEAAVPDWVFDPEEQPRLWKQIAARKELGVQQRLLKMIGSMTHFDEQAIDDFRKRLASSEFSGKASLPSKSTVRSPGLTNQQAFEQYRRMVESDLRRQIRIDPHQVGSPLMYVGAWSGRYMRRRQTIDGSYGRLADTIAQELLVEQQRARDAEESELPAWDPDVRWMIELSFKNPLSTYDAKSPYEPHGYGPSLRRLWVEATRRGKSDAEAWEDVLAWACHRPAAWQIEDWRKKKGLAYTAPTLGKYLGRDLIWSTTGNFEYPWSVDVDGNTWRVRLNDFPDDFVYTLFAGEVEIGSFHDWPENWER